VKNRRRHREVLEEMLSYGAVFVREGGNHTLYVNPRTGAPLSLPRHPYVSGGVARSLIKAAKR
jgi:predicted RNA binding protein YcfA (HicA-like mRNA interferase family)